MKPKKNPILINIFGFWIKGIVKNLPFKLPERYLHVFKDYVGKRTWIEILRDSPIRFSFGYKYGKILDFYLIQFGKLRSCKKSGYNYGGKV